MLDFAIFAVTFVIILVGAVLYLYPVSRCKFEVSLKLASYVALRHCYASILWKECSFKLPSLIELLKRVM